jgi:hypothetical protein
MFADQVKVAVADEALRLQPFYAAFSEYTRAFRDALPASQRSPDRISHLQQSAETLKEHLPEAKRLSQQAIGKLKTAGIWNNELDMLADQEMTRHLGNSGLTQPEVARVRAFMRRGATPRDNIITAVATLGTSPLTALTAAAGSPQGPDTALEGAEPGTPPGDFNQCQYWWMCCWVCCFGFILFLPGFVVCFAAGIVITLACRPF